MAILPIMTVPNPILKQVALPVEKVDDEIRQLLNDMVETMQKVEGVGLAGNQVGVLKRVFVMDTAKDGEDFAPIKIINPEIIEWSKEEEDLDQGCFSVPGVGLAVKRPATVKVRYLDETGKIHERKLSGLESHCFQHELDHINGILFIDRVSSLKRTMAMRKAQKAAREG